MIFVTYAQEYRPMSGLYQDRVRTFCFFVQFMTPHSSRAALARPADARPATTGKQRADARPTIRGMFVRLLSRLRRG